jgi:hypothetical protein
MLKRLYLAGAVLLSCVVSLQLYLWHVHQREQRFDPTRLHPHHDLPPDLGPTPDFGVFDRDGIEAALQGITVVRDSGTDEIVSITGDSLTTTTAEGTDVSTLTVTSPCSIEAVRRRVDYSTPITVLPGGARFADGGGIVSGDRTVVCLAEMVLVDVAGACRVWQAAGGGRWRPSEKACHVARSKGRVAVDVGSDHVVLAAVGAALYADLGGSQVVRSASFAEAKATADADLRAMRAALATAPTIAMIAGASDLFAGIEVKLDAYVRAVDPGAHAITLADARDAAPGEKTLTCANATAPDLRAGDRVAITATLAAGDLLDVRLDRCTVTRAR